MTDLTTSQQITYDQVDSTDIETFALPFQGETDQLAPVDGEFTRNLPVTRNRIVVLGRRAAGKTVYLSMLYTRLWKSLDGMTMSGLTGSAHSEAMRVTAGLTQGQWPPATMVNSQMPIEVQYQGRDRQMVTMDYSGEVFRRTFVEGDKDSMEAAQLLEHLDSAGAVMLMLDPAMIFERAGDIDASVDDDFGMVQAVNRVRSAAGGADVPIVIVLTKMDMNYPMVHGEGGPSRFVQNHWPALVRTLQNIRIFGISSVQTEIDAGGRALPRANSESVKIEDPLKYCLEQMDESDRREALANAQIRRQQARDCEDALVEHALRQTNRFWALTISGMCLASLGVIALIIAFY